MQKIVLITGSTDGIGLETARTLILQGHHVLIHGRNQSKLEQVEKAFGESTGSGKVESYLADFSNLFEVQALAKAISERNEKIDVLINNAGVFKTPSPVTKNGKDVRFVVNTLAPYLLTQSLLPILGAESRVINISSAAQAPVNIKALMGQVNIADEFEAYAQSKLAITMWSRALALALKDKGPIIIAVNPGSLLATKMVKQGFGLEGKDINIGVEVLCKLALDKEFENSSGEYFDNDIGEFSTPHSDVLDTRKNNAVVNAIEKVLADLNH